MNALYRAGLGLILWMTLGQFGGLVGYLQAESPANPKPLRFVELSEDEQSAALAKFEAYIEQSIQDWPVPGLAVAIVQDGRVRLARGFGIRKQSERVSFIREGQEMPSEEPVDADTLFSIASNSKAFTAAALAILVDEKKIRWDDRVQDYLPWFQLYDPTVSHELRVVDLLCHRSGLGTYSGDILWYGTNYSTEEVLRKLKHLPPASSFRSEYGYSNVMYMAAGVLVEKVSGESWTEFVQSRILAPLDMNRTVMSVSKLGDMANVANPHKSDDQEARPIEWMNWDSMVAGGGIISSANDMSRWMLLQLGRGKIGMNVIFSEDVSDEMWQAHTPIKITRGVREIFPSVQFRAYGLGWNLSDYEGRKLVAHGGGYDGMFSQQILIPAEDFGVIVLSNSMTSLANAIAYKAVDLAVGAPERDWSAESRLRYTKSRQKFRERIDKAVSTQPVRYGLGNDPSISRYESVYRCPMMGDAKVWNDNGALTFQIAANPRLIARLRKLHSDTFTLNWDNEFAWFDSGTIQFVPNAEGVFMDLKLDVPNEDLWFHELQFRRVLSSADE